MKILEILATSLAVRSSTIWLSLLGAVGGGDIMADLVSMGHVFIIERLRAAEDWCDQIFENFFFGNSLISGPNFSKDSIHEKQNMICMK